MKHLKELAYIVSRNKVKSLDILDKPNDKNSLINKLYFGILEHKFETDEMACKYLYNIDKPNAAFLKLKSRLQSRLINTLFFVDVNRPSFNDYQKAYYICYKNLAAIQILNGRNASLSALELTKKTLSRTREFEFTSIRMELCDIMRYHYAVFESNKKKFNIYDKEFKLCSKIMEAERLAREYFIRIALEFGSNRKVAMESNRLHDQFIKTLDNYRTEVDSYNFNSIYFRIKLVKYQSENDFEGTLNVCNEAIDYINSRGNIPNKVFLIIFHHQKLRCLIQLKRYEEGEDTVNTCLGLLTEGTSNWFGILNRFIILTFHTEKFNKAYEIFDVATSHPRFDYTYKKAQLESWKIFDAYINYFIRIGKINVSPTDVTRKKKFRLNKFLNEVPLFSKDKRGTNISILIIHILYLLQKREYDKVIDRVESLETYCSRYLRDKDDTFRSNCFIKMLLQIPKAHFNRNMVNQKCEKYLIKLKSKPLEISAHTNEIEIMPYEKLWEYVLESLVK